MVQTNPVDGPSRVLLCDDQRIVGAALQQMLSGFPSIIIEHVETREQLLDVLESFNPTCILQDLVLGAQSGLEVVKEIRANERYRDLPIVVLSTTEDSKTKFDAFAAGASDYIVKFPEQFELVGRILYHSRAYLSLREREEAQLALQQKSRLESLGTLAAGIAHEINTPLQYISANLSFIHEMCSEVKASLPQYSEVDAAVTETIEGINQISTIVRAMKAFAHPGKQEHARLALNEILRDVEILSKNEWKDVGTLHLGLCDNLPLVSGSPGALAQVFLNLIVNAAQALREVSENDRTFEGRIDIETRVAGEWVEVEVRDNGPGIPAEHRSKIFEPFFTTKEVGVGSGQGLSLARTTIVEGHGGELSFTTHTPGGTSFIIRLPTRTENGSAPATIN